MLAGTVYKPHAFSFFLFLFQTCKKGFLRAKRSSGEQFKPEQYVSLRRSTTISIHSLQSIQHLLVQRRH